MPDDTSGPRPEALPVPAERRPGRPYAVPAPEASERPVPEHSDELTRLRAERDQYAEALRRMAAEFANYRKRMLREQTAHVDRAEARLMRRLLPVLDVAELGARHHPDTVGPVYRHLYEILTEAGLHRVEPHDAPFDPVEHEAVEHERVMPLRASETEQRATTLRPGYRLHGRLLRPALVRVHSG